MADRSIIEQLQKQILDLQGMKQTDAEQASALGLGAIESAFPGNVFPRGVTHELISYSSENASCTNAFIAVILGKLMRRGGSCIWVSTGRKIYPPALKSFGVDPERILFIDAKKIKEALWMLEESLRCSALAGVVGEVSELSFNDSRRLQLAVEQSRVTGFIHRQYPRSENAVTCVSRWKISSLASTVKGKMPGLGYSKWQVQLLKARHGVPAEWQVQWSPRGLEIIHPEIITAPQSGQLQTG